MKLEKLNLEELNAQEMKNIEGGFWGALFFLAMCIIGYHFATDGNENTALIIDGNRVGN